MNDAALYYAGYGDEISHVDLQSFGLDQRVRTLGDIHGQRLPSFRRFMQDYDATVPGSSHQALHGGLIGLGIAAIPTAILMGFTKEKNSALEIVGGTALAGLLGGFLGYALGYGQHQQKINNAFSRTLDHIATNDEAREKVAKSQSYRELILAQRGGVGVQSL